ncbi:MAG: hydrolase [Magnetovibrio sp.]|nr:hydrolase [Magnetovibrio sp.]
MSQYIEVRDGTKLAVDVHFPGTSDTGELFPVVLILTPYYRRFALRTGHRPDIDPCPTIAFYRDIFVPRGYALVVVDVRGSGASFGCRDGFRSPKERLDHFDIADWIAVQPWGTGRIGATEISYPGAASDFLASTAHPAVKAVAPLFSVWDTWSNHLYPGGILLNCVTKSYGQLAQALDQDRRDLIPAFAYFNDVDLAGPAPVDGDVNGKLLRQAIQEHMGNFDMQDFAQQMRFRDAGLTDNPEYTSVKISPYYYANKKSDQTTAYYSISGWMDGGGYSTGTIQRHLWLKNPENRLMLGPWDHGARANASPWRPNNEPQQPIVGASVLRFFDKHLKQIDTNIEVEKSVHYYTMGIEKWRAVDTWPPPYNPLELFLASKNSLKSKIPNNSLGHDVYQADYTCGTGKHTRYDRLYLADVETYYDDWDGRDKKMLLYKGRPLRKDIEVTGHAFIDLHFACSERDCCFFIYLSDLLPSGKSVYVTEGIFRALHRKPGALPCNVPSTGPAHSFNKIDAEILVKNEPANVSFELLPTSYLFKKGHRIQISIGASDTDHFSRIPDGRPPRITVFRNNKRPTRLVLPVVV